jgi:hypothetical protein
MVEKMPAFRRRRANEVAGCCFYGRSLTLGNKILAISRHWILNLLTENKKPRLFIGYFVLSSPRAAAVINLLTRSQACSLCRYA